MAKSDKEKKVQGTYRPDRKKPVIEFGASWPEPQSFILDNEVAMETYKIICAHLAKFKLLEDADKMVISQAAFSWATYVKYASVVNDSGIEHEVGEHGTKQVAPAYTAMKDAIAAFNKSQDLLGLSPKARKLMAELFVQPEVKEDKKDPVQLRKLG